MGCREEVEASVEAEAAAHKDLSLVLERIYNQNSYSSQKGAEEMTKWLLEKSQAGKQSRLKDMPADIYAHALKRLAEAGKVDIMNVSAHAFIPYILRSFEVLPM